MIKKRRKHPRLRIPLEAEYLVAGQQEWRQGTIWTLGAGGVALLCEEELEVGTLLEGLHFMVEAEGDLPETRIEVSAEVVNVHRQERIGRASNFMLGLQFSGLGEPEFELLRQFVFRRLTSQGAASSDGDPVGAEDGPPPIEIRYKLFDDFVEEVSENLSPSGMFIRAHRPLPPGSQFVFHFQLGEDFALFQGTAEVIWTRRRGEGPDRPPGMGVRFLKLDLTSQKLVERLVGQGAEEEAGRAGQAGRAADDSVPASAPDAPLPDAPAPRPEAVVRLAEEAGEPFRVEDIPAGTNSSSEVEAANDQRLAQMHDDLDRLQKRLGEAVAARDAAREAGEEAEAARAETEARLVELGEQAEVLRQENEGLRAACDQAEEARGRLEEEAGDLRRELEELGPDGAAAAEAEELRRELAERRDEWAGLEAELRERLDRAGEAEAGLRQRLERAEADAEELERQTDRADEAEDGLERLRQELAESRREWKATESELRAQLAQRSAEGTKLGERLDRAVAAETELRGLLVEAQDSRDEKEERLALAAEVEEALREQARDLRTERDRLRARLGRMRGTAEELRSKLNGDLSSARALETDLSHRLAEVAALGVGLERKVAGLAEARAGLAERLARIGEAWSSLEGGLEEDEEADLEEAAPESTTEEIDRAVESATAPEAIEVAGERLAAAEPVEEAEDWAAAAEAVEEADEPGIAAEPVDEEPAAERRVSGEGGEEEVDLPADATEEAAAAEAEMPVEESEASSQPEPAEITASAADGGGFLGAARRMAARLGLARQDEIETPEPAAEDERLAPVEPEPTAAQAAPEPDQDSPLAASDRAIEETVRSWAAAWSERRVEDYLSFYSETFQPARPDEDEDEDEEADGAAHAWLPPLAGMELTLGPISSTELGPGRVAVRFEQSVESDSYTRRTGRTLEMIREADAWKIAAESFQDLPG